jgi:phage gp45-like
MNREDANTLRGLAVRGLVHRVDDASAAQRLDVETHEGVVRSGVEVLQPYGLASAPAAGGLTVVIALGGDQGDLVALPMAQPASRMGGLAPGQTALYDDTGSRVLLGADGKVTIAAASEVAVEVGGVALRVTPQGVLVVGNLFVTRSVIQGEQPGAQGATEVTASEAPQAFRVMEGGAPTDLTDARITLDIAAPGGNIALSSDPGGGVTLYDQANPAERGMFEMRLTPAQLEALPPSTLLTARAESTAGSRVLLIARLVK